MDALYTTTQTAGTWLASNSTDVHLLRIKAVHPPVEMSKLARGNKFEVGFRRDRDTHGCSAGGRAGGTGMSQERASTEQDPGEAEEHNGVFVRFLRGIEKAGNLLPHPFWLFVILGSSS